MSVAANEVGNCVAGEVLTDAGQNLIGDGLLVIDGEFRGVDSPVHIVGAGRG